jgi:hypothetical protein
MFRTRLILATGLAALAVLPTVALAEISAEEAARLDQDLTPFGAIRAGNESGSIPAWDGGIKNPADAGFPDFKTGGHHPDPFADDAVLYTINAANMAEYDGVLTETHKALLKTYPDYFMNVYPTRRSAAAPQRIYDATKRIATTASLIEGGNGVVGGTVGVPFPIPKDGVEAIWNHILRWRTVSAERAIGQTAVTREGSYTMVKFIDNFLARYHEEGVTEEELDNVIIYFKQRVAAPARLAGEVLLVHETMDQNKENRRAWLYNPGQRRVRRAPNVAFDNPRTASDGQATADQLDMFNGSPERYDWTLVGRKEMVVPYNTYKIHSNDLKYEEILTPLHVNQDLVRYETHRVWVVEANLKQGTRHIYKKRTFYIDEDSWQILVVDCYDTRDQIWRVQEGLAINYYDEPNFWTTLEVTYDLQSGRYLAIGLNNEEPITYDFTKQYSLKDFSPASLRRAGVR